MGDVAQALRVAEYLKLRQNIETIGWIAEEPVLSLIKSYHYVDIVIPINSKKIRGGCSLSSSLEEWKNQKKVVASEGEWDMVFDLQGNVKSALVNLSLKAKHKIGYGWKTAPEKCNVFSTTDRVNPPPGLSMRDEYLWIVQSFFEDKEKYTPGPSIPLRLTVEQQKSVENEIKRWPQNGEKPIWIISSGSRWINKTCSSSSMLEILQRASDALNGIFFLFVAGSCEELREVGYFASHFISSSVVLFQPELPILSHLIMQADRVLSMDSLILHLASLTDTPTFSFYGPSSSAKYAPMRRLDGLFQGVCPYGEQFIKRCRILRSCASGACLRDASPQDMASTLLQWDESIRATQK